MEESNMLALSSSSKTSKSLNKTTPTLPALAKMVNAKPPKL